MSSVPVKEPMNLLGSAVDATLQAVITDDFVVGLKVAQPVKDVSLAMLRNRLW